MTQSIPAETRGHVLVVGLGASGLAVCRLQASRGGRVIATDLKPAAAFPAHLLAELEGLGVGLELGAHRPDAFLAAETVIVSPGVPLDLAPLKAARARGVPVMGEIEWASRQVKAPMIAITGSNGKSTVTALVGSLLDQAGYRVFVGGNFGTPLATYVAGTQDADYVVLEISSFQLDTADTFAPQVAVILNITPDHLDRYPDYEAYVRSKLSIAARQRPGQHLILNDDDPRLHAFTPAAGVTVWRHAYGDRPGLQAGCQSGSILVRPPAGAACTYSLERFVLPGRHNVENLMSGLLAVTALGVEGPIVQRGVDAFKGLANRLEFVAEVAGVAFYNDSKATNVDAAIKAVESFACPVVLIAGGRHKGAAYDPLWQAARGRVRQAVFVGEAGPLLAASCPAQVPHADAANLPEAVKLAFAAARKGDVVLLAPACSSFDMFTDYAHRGQVFRAAVEGLRHG